MEPKKKPNQLLKDSLKVNAEARLANVRGYLINENRTVSAKQENKVVSNSPLKANGKRESTLNRGLKCLAKLNATQQKKHQSTRSSDLSSSKTLRFADDPPPPPSAMTTTTKPSTTSSVSSKSAGTSMKALDFKRAGYVVSKHGTLKKKSAQYESSHSNEQRFVGFVDTCGAVSARQELKNRLGMTGKGEVKTGTETGRAVSSAQAQSQSQRIHATQAVQSTVSLSRLQPTGGKQALPLSAARAVPSSRGERMSMPTHISTKAMNPFSAPRTVSPSAPMSSVPGLTISDKDRDIDSDSGRDNLPLNLSLVIAMSKRRTLLSQRSPLCLCQKTLRAWIT